MKKLLKIKAVIEVEPGSEFQLKHAGSLIKLTLESIKLHLELAHKKNKVAIAMDGYSKEKI